MRMLPHPSNGRAAKGDTMQMACYSLVLLRFTPKADMCAAKGHVRFTPESGHVQCTSSCLLWANSGHSCTPFLNRRTRHVAIRAEHTTVARLGLRSHTASLAVIEELASVGWHLLDGLMRTLWTRDRGGFDHIKMNTYDC